MEKKIVFNLIVGNVPQERANFKNFDTNGLSGKKYPEVSEFI